MKKLKKAQSEKEVKIAMILNVTGAFTSVLQEMLQHKAIAYTSESLKIGPVALFLLTAKEAAEFVNAKFQEGSDPKEIFNIFKKESK